MSLRKQIKDSLISIISYFERRRDLKIGNRGYKSFSKIERAPLSDLERQIISEKWGKCIPNPKIGYDQFALYKYLHGFDVDFVPNSYFHPYIGKYLLDNQAGKILSNKNMLWSFLHGLPQVGVMIRKFEGRYYDDNFDEISTEKAVKILKEYAGDKIIKQATDSFGGASIKLIKSDLSDEELQEMLSNFSNDFVVQGKVNQSEELSILNPTSLNTLRVNTLFLNGKFSVTTMGLRIGGRGSVVDNASSGGVMAGVNDDGSLKKFAYDLYGHKTDIVNGVQLAPFKVPNVKGVKELCVAAHKRMLQSKMIAWDIAIDVENKPLILEANVGYTGFYPGIRAIQLCSGPVFGNRTQEVIDFVSKRQILDKKNGRKLILLTETISK